MYNFVPLLEGIRCDEINDITINSINKECFDFLQLLLSKHSSIWYETQWFGGHVHTRNEITVLNCTAPKCVHPSQYQLRWIRLKDKIVKLVMNNIKQLKKVSCNCMTNLHSINELVICFTPINYDKENNALNVCITWLIDCLRKNNGDEDKQCLGFSWGWPLYKYLENDAERNHDIFNDDTPLISQIPQEYWNEQIVQIASLNIDHCNSIMEKDYDGIHMIKQEWGDLIFNNVTFFCHRGDKKMFLQLLTN